VPNAYLIPRKNTYVLENADLLDLSDTMLVFESMYRREGLLGPAVLLSELRGTL